MKINKKDFKIKKKTTAKDIFIAFFGFFGFIYLLNFGFGVFEFLPDNLPIVGNIDEAVAFYIFYYALDYFNLF